MVLSYSQKAGILVAVKMLIPVEGNNGYSFGVYKGEEVLYYKRQNRNRSVASAEEVLALIAENSFRR